MSRDRDDEYFPTTPTRHFLRSPDKPTYGSGSVSSSISSPPNGKNYAQDEMAEEGNASPAIPQLKKASGFASVGRVGLGSPGIMKRTWTGASSSPRVDDGMRGSGGRIEGLPEGSLSSRSFVVQNSGLPTPPGTENDIGPPPPLEQEIVSHSPRKVSPQASPPRPPRHPRRTSSQHLPDLPDPDSPGPSSQRSSPHLQSEVFQRRVSPSISRSSSTSSGLALSTVRERVTLDSPGEGSRTIRRGYQYDSGYQSPRRVSTDGGRQEYLASPEREPHRSGSVSPRKAHQRSPSLPVDPRRPVSRTRQSLSSSRRDLSIEEADEVVQVRSPVGISLDDRIRGAEEKITEEGKKRTTSRRPRTAGHVETTPPISGSTRRNDSYSRSTHSPSNTTSTLRRSATVSSASVLTPNGGSDSSGRRNGTMARVAGTDDPHERDNSGGSGSSGRRKPIPAEFRNGSLFSPPSKQTSPAVSLKTELTSSRSQRFTPSSPANYSPAEKDSPSRYATMSRLQNSHTSPIHRFLPQRNVESRQSPREDAGGHSGYSTRESRDWRDSISGLPDAAISQSRLPVSRPLDNYPIRRADSVLGTNNDRYRYETRGGNVESALANQRNRDPHSNGAPSRSSPRYALGPGDSVSLAGGNGREPMVATAKDPLEVLKRMEEKRNQHREQWEAERSASVMGDHHHHGGPRPNSRLFDATPRHARPSTSMSSMRDVYDGPVPRTAPIESWRARRDQVMAGDSPLIGRGSRLRELPKPATEPRPMRSSTSMGGRSSTNLDFAAPATEHGRLLFEACRALELKLGPDILAHVPELTKTFHSSTRTAEHVNSSLRDALQLINDASVRLDLDDIEKARQELVKLDVCIRDANRASDQNVREFTRIMLDLPKLLRQADKAGLGRLQPRTSSPGQYDSPVRASHDMMRPSTSLGEISSPTYRYSLDSRRPVLQPRLQPLDRDRSSAVSNLVAKMKGLTPKRSPLPQHSDLQTIDQSPPHQLTDRIPPNPVPLASSQSRTSLSHSSSPTKSSRSSIIAPRPLPPPRSPERKNVLRKKASSTSTHTVRGSSAFMPTSSKVQTTTALSVVNHLDHLDSESDLTPAKSIRSNRTTSTMGHGSDNYAGSPTSAYSFTIDPDARDRSSMESGISTREDAVSILEHSLAAAAKNRGSSEEERKPSVSERFRATLRRGSSIRAKE